MTIARSPGSLKVAQWLFLSVIAALGTIILSDSLEDTLIDGCSFNYTLAIIGVLFLVAVIAVYKFESTYAELYTNG